MNTETKPDAAQTNAAKHTPTPWHQSRDENQRERIYADDGTPITVAMSVGSWDEMDSNAARIVQCVNACEGIKNPAGLLPLLRLCLAQLDVATGAGPETTAAKKLREMIGELPVPTGVLGVKP
jgi:hypothetical protein